MLSSSKRIKECNCIRFSHSLFEDKIFRFSRGCFCSVMFNVCKIRHLLQKFVAFIEVASKSDLLIFEWLLEGFDNEHFSVSFQHILTHSVEFFLKKMLFL